jgi:hypothetical protein
MRTVIVFSLSLVLACRSDQYVESRHRGGGTLRVVKETSQIGDAIGRRVLVSAYVPLVQEKGDETLLVDGFALRCVGPHQNRIPLGGFIFAEGVIDVETVHGIDPPSEANNWQLEQGFEGDRTFWELMDCLVW